MDDFSARFATVLGDCLPDIAATIRPEGERLVATLPSPSGRGTLCIETESDNVIISFEPWWHGHYSANAWPEWECGQDREPLGKPFGCAVQFLREFLADRAVIMYCTRDGRWVSSGTHHIWHDRDLRRCHIDYDHYEYLSWLGSKDSGPVPVGREPDDSCGSGDRACRG